MNVSLGDLATAYYSTGIPNIETYVEATPLIRALLTACRSFGRLLRTAPMQVWLGAWAEMLPPEPKPAQDGAMTIVAEASDDAGHRACARLRTPEAYEFTGITDATVGKRVSEGDLEVGFQTPARVYGRDFVLGFAGVTREEVE
jgi:short subunit dehydrogenase-like uncharacterized protein